MPEDKLQSTLEALLETSKHLADTASSLAWNAVPAAVPVEGEAGGRRSPPDLAAAIAAGAPFSVPSAGLPNAQLLSETAAPIARSAPLIATAVPVFAPLISAR
jgi:hypothetical protein